VPSETVSAPAPVTYLVDLAPISGGLTPKSAKVNGKTYDYSLLALRNPGDGTPTEYDINREYSEFKVTVGLRDDSSDTAKQRFEVIGDGVRLDAKTVKFNQTGAISVSVKGVLRLKLVIITSSEQYAPCVAVWGNARLIK
jgi:hypothetical protein